MLTTTKIENPFAKRRYRSFRLLLIYRFLAALGGQMVAVGIGWQIYTQTQNALALGLVGLIEIIPVIVFSLPDELLLDDLLDRFSCKSISLITRGCLALLSLALGLLSMLQGPLWLLYILILLIGFANTVARPANAALIEIPASFYGSAAFWDRNSWLLASALGSVLGGLLILLAKSIGIIYFINMDISLICLVLIAAIRSKPPVRPRKTTKDETLAAGIRFLRESPLVLSVVTLDLFAVLLGGATILLPIFATAVLHVGPTGFGWLRATPSIGAILMTLFLAHRPPFRKAGRTLLWAVAGGGAAMIVFGLSRSFPLSLAMLFVLGALNNISVMVRNALMTTVVPDDMRERVAAVNRILIGSSNGLGIFESGAMASLFATPLGSVISVVGGGVCAIVLVPCCILIWPELHNLGEQRPPQ